MQRRGVNEIKSIFSNIEKRSFAVSEKQVRSRIKSIVSIEKITKAMKMVATSKMKSELGRLQNGRKFGHGSIEMVFKSDSYLQRKMPTFSDSDSVLLVPITSDKGLCGGINSAIVREVKAFVKAHDRSKIGIFTIGKKGTSALLRPFPDLMKESISDVQTPLSYPSIMAIASELEEHAADYDKIILIYNEYKNAISTVLRKLELFPRHKILDSLKFLKKYEQKSPEGKSSNIVIYDLYLSSNIYQAYLNNMASEQSARMTAMESASKNAGEIIEKLNLMANKARQSKITSELCEIISGANAI